MENETKQKGTDPLAKFRGLGGVSGAIFPPTQTVNGPLHTARIDRRYKNKAGEWVSTNNYTEQQLDQLISVALEAKAFFQTLK